MPDDITITFKGNEQFSDLLGKASFDIDEGKSKIIRACILLSIDTIIATPSLCNRVQIEDRKSNNR